jgi:AcrR family transcriptional regulator
MGIPERKEREFRRREEVILAAALSLLDRDDWLTVTIDEIAQKAEIGKGTVYLHFPSKEALYARLALDFSHGLFERMREIPPQLPVLDRLAARVRLFIDGHRLQPEYRRLLEYCWRENFLQGLPQPLVAEFMSLEAEYERLVFADLEEAMALGLVPAGSLQALGQALRGVVLGAVHVLWSGCFDRMGAEPSIAGGAAADYVDRVVPFAVAGLRFQHVAFDIAEPTTIAVPVSEV